MLFSQPDVAAFLSDRFECAWESVRPVPRLTIDFGDGRRLERTLRGNIATYVCTSEAETIDLVAGLMDGREYMLSLRDSLRLFESLRGRTREERLSAVSLTHGLLATPSLVPGATADARPVPFGASKFRVENVLERSLVAETAPDAGGLVLDTRFAQEQGHRLARSFLSARALESPASLTRDVYRELLHVELDDPYLGLAPDVLGGEAGRH